MGSTLRSRIAVLAVLVGCGFSSRPIGAATQSDVHPSVEISAPAPGDSVHNAVLAHWHGSDADGFIEHYRYALDGSLGAIDTFWTDTGDTARYLILQSRNYTPGPTINPVFTEMHHFLIEAIDNTGLLSPWDDVVFQSWTYAPQGVILFPRPSKFTEFQVNGGFFVRWTGIDQDGIFTPRPVFYRSRILGPGSDFSVAQAAADPDSFRRYSVAQNWSGWTISAADSTAANFYNLTPGAHYLFAVVAFDEVGAYDPIWSADKNLLRIRVNNVVAVEGSTPAPSIELSAPAPNPASTPTTLTYRVPRAGRVSLAIYDASGRRVATLATGDQVAGEHRAVWDLRDARGRAVRAGAYVARLEAGGERRSQRVFVVP